MRDEQIVGDEVSLTFSGNLQQPAQTLRIERIIAVQGHEPGGICFGQRCIARARWSAILPELNDAGAGQFCTDSRRNIMTVISRTIIGHDHVQRVAIW